jgi:hypothetical protein
MTTAKASPNWRNNFPTTRRNKLELDRELLGTHERNPGATKDHSELNKSLPGGKPHHPGSLWVCPCVAQADSGSV